MMKDRILAARLAMSAAVVIAALYVATISLPYIVMFGFGAFELLLDPLNRHPFRIGGIFLLVCAVLFLCFFGARISSHTSISVVSRAVLLLASVVAWVLSLGFFGLSAQAHGGPLLLFCILLLFGILFLALAAAAIKYSVGWPVSYWMTFLATIASLPPMVIVIAGLEWMRDI
jgi:hypothetical protein